MVSRHRRKKGKNAVGTELLPKREKRGIKKRVSYVPY